MSAKLCLLFMVALVICALNLVTSQYQARTLFIAIERAQTQTRQLEMDFAQLQVDQSTYGKNARVEALARDQLRMVLLTPDRVQYLVAGSK